MRKMQVLISTPLNLVNRLGEKKLKRAKYLIFDECDVLLDMGYLPQIDEICKLCVNKNVLKFMFSATLLPDIEILAKTMMIAPVKVVVGLKNTTVDTVE